MATGPFNIFNLRLDLDKRSAMQVVTIRQGDVDGTTITASVYDHGTAAALTGATAYFEMALPDGEHYYRKAAAASGGSVSVTVDETEAASVAGRVCNAYFTLTIGDATYSTAPFTVVVLPDALADMEPSESYDSAIQDAIDRCNDAAAAAESLIPVTTANIADGAVTPDKLADAVRKGYVRSFETVAAMQAATDLKAGMTCHTNGFHASGDGGAAYYTISASGTANGMDVLALQGGLKAALVVTEPYVTPEMFGAYGDGTHDDTAALRKCISNDTTVELTGTYLISGVLDTSGIHDLTLRGGTITREANQTFNTISGSGCKNILIEGVTFDGNGNSRDTSYEWRDNMQACIILMNSTEINVEKCSIVNHNYGLYIVGAGEQGVTPTFDNSALVGTIRDCMFYNCHSGVDTYGKALAIEHNVFYGITDNALQIEPNYVSSEADNPTTDSNWYTAAAACSITDNLFIDIAATAILIHGNNSYAIAIKNNTIINFTIGINNNSGKSFGVTIDGNHLYYQKPQTVDSNTRPWNLNPAITASGRSVVANNYIWKADVGIKAIAGAIIADNVIELPNISAITVYMLSSLINEVVTITNNKVVGHVRNTSAWWASRAIVIGYSKNLLFDNNVIDSDAQPIRIESGSTAFVTRLYSNVAQTDAITAPSDYVAYSN